MMLKSITIFLFTFCLLACQKQQEQISVEEEKEMVSNKVSERDINKMSFKDLALSEEAENLTNSWLKYVELQSHINEIRKADLVFFKNNYADINMLFNDIKKEIPEKFNTNIIISRINLLDTKIAILCGNLNKSYVSKNTLLKNIKDVLEANSTLNLHIERKIEFDEFYVVPD